MKLKLLLSACFLFLAAIMWQACEKTAIPETTPGIDNPVSSRSTVVFNDVCPAATVDGHQLTSIQVYGGASGEDTIRVRSTGIQSISVLGFGNSCYMNSDTLAARGFVVDSTFKIKTTAAFRACWPVGGSCSWDATVNY